MKKQADFYDNLGNNIRMQRKMCGLSAADLACRMTDMGDQVSPSMIGAWQRGQRSILAHHLQIMADALGCTVQHLYVGSIAREQMATRVIAGLLRMTERQKETLLYIVNAWDGQPHALLEWVRMYVSVPRPYRADISGLAINQVSHLVQNGIRLDLSVDLKELEHDCRNITK